MDSIPSEGQDTKTFSLSRSENRILRVLPVCLRKMFASPAVLGAVLSPSYYGPILDSLSMQQNNTNPAVLLSRLLRTEQQE